MLKKLFTILILTLCVVVNYTNAENRNNKDTLILGWTNNVGPLNPHMYTPNEMFALVMSYDPLVRYNGKDIEPALAESWNISADGKTYTFKLKKGIKFADGTPFNSKAVAMNFEAIMSNIERHKWLALTNMIDSWKTPDNYTFVLNLKKPYNLTLVELSLPRPFRILSPTGFIDGEINSSKGIKKPIGTGPWTLLETKLGKYDLFIKNKYYWGNKPNFDKVKVLVLPDPNSRIIALETNQIDILLGESSFTVENYVRLSKNPKYIAVKSKPRITNMIALNSAKGNTQNIEVRKAIMHAVNKEALVKHILLNQEEIAHQFYNPNLKYCNVKLEPFEYNIEKSNNILDKAGWKKSGIYRKKEGSLLELNFHYEGTNAKHKAIAEAIQADLMKIGIKVNLKAEESTIFYSLQANGNFDIIFNKTWGPPFEPGSFTYSMKQPVHADYQAQKGLKEKANIDKAISDLILSTDEKYIQDKYRYILTTLHNEAVYLPFSYELDLALFKKDRIKNFKFGDMSMEFMLHDIELNK